MEITAKYKHHDLIAEIEGWPYPRDARPIWYVEFKGRKREIEDVPWEVEDDVLREYTSILHSNVYDLYAPND